MHPTLLLTSLLTLFSLTHACKCKVTMLPGHAELYDNVATKACCVWLKAVYHEPTPREQGDCVEASLGANGEMFGKCCSLFKQSDSPGSVSDCLA